VLGGVARTAGVLLHGAGHLGHRVGRVAQVGHLRLGARGQVGIAAGDLARRQPDLLGRGLDAADDAIEPFAHFRQRRQQAARLALVEGDRHRQVAGGDAARDAGRVFRLAAELHFDWWK
jgi:hypothetical protein